MARSKKRTVKEAVSKQPDSQSAAQSAELSPTPVRLALLILIALGLFATFWVGLNAVRIFCFGSMDTFWLIQAGRDILSQTRIPQGDLYSYTNFGKPWVVYQWLFEVALAALNNIGGLQALQAAAAVLATFIFPVLALQGMTRNGVSYWVALWVCAAATAACYTFLMLRPHFLSVLFVYLIQRALDHNWQKPGRGIFWLIPLFLVWANIHLIFPVGLSMMAIYWGCSLVMLCTAGKCAAEEKLLREKRFRLFSSALPLCLTVTLLNPYGWNIYTYGLQVSSEGFWTSAIGEMKAPHFDDPVGAFILGYIMTTIVSFVLNVRRPTLPEGIIYGLWLMAGLTTYKMLPYFVAATIHGTGLRLQAAASQLITWRLPDWLIFVTRTLGRWSQTPVYAALLLIAALIFGLTRPVLFPPFVPVEATDYLEEHPIPGHIFTAAKFGCYLIYRFQGRVPVYIDTRFDMYGPKFSDAYFIAHHEGVGFNDIVDKYRIKAAFVETDSGIARLLWASPDWSTVYADKKAMIFIKKNSS